jgi:hypothetical protein
MEIAFWNEKTIMIHIKKQKFPINNLTFDPFESFDNVTDVRYFTA